LWFFLSPPYHALLADSARLWTTVTAPGTTNAVVRDGDVLVVHAEGKSSPFVDLRVMSFQFTIVFALFAMQTIAEMRRRFWRLPLGLLGVALSHMLALGIGVHSSLAVGFGDWSERHYGVIATNVLFFLWQGYLVVGGYALTVALGWSLFDLNLTLYPRARDQEQPS
jgi:hypothetical protein